LKIAHKDRLKAEYKELSRMIHPSHKQKMTLLHEIETGEEGVPIIVNCEELSNIYESMKKMYDIFFFVIFNHFPELRESMKSASDFVSGVKSYKLRLVAESIGVKL
jgi:hypothetical protein